MLDPRQSLSFDSSLQPSSLSKLTTSESLSVDPFPASQIPFNTSLLSTRSASLDTMSLSAASNGTRMLDAATQLITGSLRADTFTIGGVAKTIVSGNGNVDFGNGYRDTLDLSGVSSTTVSLNRVEVPGQGGLVYNPGNGNRVFDAINFSDGRQVLFESLDAIRFADGVLNLSITPNDPLFSKQWNLHMMGVQNAWRFTQGSDRVLVGVEDSGLSTINNFIHQDLSRTTWMADGQGVDDTYTNHGTSVHGIIAATTNNGSGMSGINWNSPVFNIDVNGGERGDLSLADASRQIIDQARQHGQRLVINLSIQSAPEGKGAFDQNYHPDLEQVVKNNPDVLFVISAGNYGHQGVGLSSPAVLAKWYTNVIAVGAASGTQWGTTAPGSRFDYSQYGEGLTIMGPSEVIAPTTFIENGAIQFGYTSSYNGSSTYYGVSGPFDGTSAAAPNVTGVTSLVLSANPGLSAAQVKQILSQTAVDLEQPGYDIGSGHGFVNADAAVRRAIAIGRGFA